MSRTRLARRKAFQCLHRYEVAAWSDQKNSEILGACFTPQGHGHNYEMEVYLEGPVDPTTGMILNLVDVDQVLEGVVAPLKGKHLDLEVPEFKDKVPTTEMLAQYLYERTVNAVAAPVHVAKLRLYEHEDLWVDIWP